MTEVIRGRRAIRAGSLTVSVRSIRTSGLRSIQAYRSALPNANDAVTGWPGSSAPALARPSTPSLNISDHTASPRLRVQPGQDGVRDGADAGLQRRAVADKRGHPVTDDWPTFPPRAAPAGTASGASASIA